MKICILGNQSRSVSNFWTVLLNHIKQAGHTSLCCVPEDESPDEVAYREKLSVISTQLSTYPLARKGINPFVDARSLYCLYRLFVREKPDYLFATTIKPVIYGCLAAKWAHIPHIYATITGLGYTFERDSFAKQCIHILAKNLYKQALCHIDGVFFQNPDDVATFTQANIVDKKTRILMARGTGVDTKHFAKANLLATDTITFLFVGRLLYAKGLEEYVESAKIVRSQYPNTRFQILGPMEEGFGGIPDALLHQWQDEGNIEYLGATRDVRPFLTACHVLVLPSWREGTPTSVMEAMSMGRAAIVTDAPGCREVVVDGENGFIVPVRDPNQLAKAMLRFVINPSLIDAFGAKSRTMAETIFDADIVANKILADMGL